MYLVTDAAVEDIAGNVTQKFSRIFYQQEDYLDLHLNILRGIQQRYQTPFFTALRKIQPPTHRRVSRDADFARQIGDQVTLDQGYGRSFTG